MSEIDDIDLVSGGNGVDVKVWSAEFHIATSPTGIGIVWCQEVTGLKNRRAGYGVLA